MAAGVALAGLRGELIFVDQAAEQVAAADAIEIDP
jgi:hypothetical protein